VVLPGPPAARGGTVELKTICCDSCPYNPTCEEENDFLRDIGLADDDWGEEP